MRIRTNKGRYPLRAPFWIAAGFLFSLTSCDSERREARDLISERGVTASGESLLTALEGGDGELAEALLDLEMSPDIRDSSERTPLMLAAGGSTPFLVSRILESGVDVEARDVAGRTALVYAVESGNLEAVMILLESGANPTVAIPSGGSLVALALEQGKLASADLLLQAGASSRSRGSESETLARIAVEKGSLAILKKLTDRGLDLMEESGAGEGLSHLALAKGHAGVLAFLLEKGSDPDERNAAGETLLHSALSASRLDLLPLLMKYGASPDAFDPQGRTPLHRAILAENRELLERLLAGGADIEKGSDRIDEVRSPLSLAISKERFDMARLLARYGAKPRDELYQAVKRGGLRGRRAVELLLDNGASANPSRAPMLDSPLGLAVRKGENGIAKLLLDAGASHNSRDLSGQKPLHIAVAMGNAALVGLLLDLGADPDESFYPEMSETFLDLVKSDGIARWALKNSKEIYPIMVAADSGNLEVARQLAAHGAHLSRSSKVKSSRFWPLTFATRQNDVEMMQLLLGRKPGKSKLWIRVDLSEQRAYLFEDEKEIFTTRVSTGKSGYRTRKGEFIITNKYTDWKSTIYESSMPYFQRLSASDFGFHVGYVPGYAASHGCIRMPHSAARKLFKMTKIGDYVEIIP